MDPGQFHHVFNHANGRENLFVEEKNYSFFLEKFVKHILPVCRTYAYCLMKNHFHVLVQVRFKKELEQLWANPGITPPLTDKTLILKTSKAFSNFFSSYTQSFNKVYKRRGSLFIPSMKTEIVDDDISFRRVVHYIHKNPVHHGFVDDMVKWPHSSFKIFLNKEETFIERDHVLKVFGGIEKFIDYHNQPLIE